MKETTAQDPTGAVGKRPLPRRFPRGFHALLLFVFACSLLSAYSPAFHAPFYYDDVSNIVDSPVLRLSPTDVLGWVSGEVRRASVVDRPLAILSFALNRWAWGNAPAAFRAVNLALHLGTALVFFLLLRRLADREVRRGRETEVFAFWFPAGAALLWALHPVQTQTVTFIVQRMNGGMAFFFIASVLAFVSGIGTARARAKIGFLILSLFLGILSLGFKQNALLLPYAWVLAYLFFLREEDGRTTAGDRPTPVAPFLLLAGWTVLLAAAAWKMFPPASPGGAAWIGHWLTEARVIPHYLGLYFLPLPSRFHLNYDFQASTGILSPPATAAGIVLILALIGFAAWAWRKDRWLAFGIAWTIVMIFPESAIPSIDFVFEHRLYLPSMGLAVAASRLAYLGYEQFGRETAFRGKAAASGAFLLLVLLSAATFQRNRVWADPERFWTHEMAMAPGSAHAFQGMMVTFLQEKKFREAIRFGEEGLKRNLPEDDAANLWTNLALAYAGAGDWPRMKSMLEKSIFSGGGRKFEVYNLGVAFFHLGEMGDAERRFLRVLEIDPENPDALVYLGRIHAARREHRTAIGMFNRGLSARRGDPDALQGIVDSLAALQDWKEGSDAVDRLLAAQGGSVSPNVLFQSGYIYTRGRRLDKAGAVWETYLLRYPGDPEANYNMACVQALRGEPDRSLSFLDRALEAGLRRPELLTDPDLDAVRRQPGFRNLLRKYGL